MVKKKMFKPGDLIITTDHVCRSIAGPWNSAMRRYPDLEPADFLRCLERGEIGMILTIRYKPMMYYRLLVGDKIMNVDVGAHGKYMKLLCANEVP